MTNSEPTNLLKLDSFKNLSAEPLNELILTWFPPVIQDLYERDEKNRQLLNPVLNMLEDVLTEFSLNIGTGICPNCSNHNQETKLTIWYKKKIPVLTTGNIIINVEVTRYRCWRCEYHTEDQHDLTLPNGIYDRGIVLNAVAFYTCGCSYELTRSLIFSLFHVAPIKSTILEWVQQIGKISHSLNREVLQPVKGINITWDEFFVAVRDGKTEGSHSSAFSTVFMDVETGAVLCAGVNEGKQTNKLIVRSHLNKVKHHEPVNGVADGCSSYPSPVKEILPGMNFYRDPVHQARNVRKKPRMKKMLKEKVEFFRGERTAQWTEQILFDRKIFFQELEDFFLQYSDNEGMSLYLENVKNDWLAVEEKEIHSLKEITNEETLHYHHSLHRSLYAGQVAKQMALAKDENQSPLAKPLHSCRLEGWNRVLRSREKRMLCYRSSTSFYAMIGLLALLHNMVGTGKGCLYDLLNVSGHNTRWNPFANFLPVKKTENELNPPFSTPYRHTKRVYRQQHSHQLSFLNREQLESNHPIDQPLSTEEMLMF